jgi:diaminohydroxyphosphoribosylaminopyrimidine deaminase/5-amino-6-(5-phosphoribosylamino)uracil reductase
MHMRRALALAEATVALASPNPHVGCVLTRDGQSIGEGEHLYDRLDHAEIAALKSCAVDPRGATSYVTLEPCSHHGRTPPCADALVSAGIARCFIATLDPNPQVAGRGAAKLRAAGIEVEVGLYEAEARALNDAFAWSITRGRPFVTLKSALSVDGRLAPPVATRLPNQPFWLSGPAARSEVQALRHGSDAILTGIGTVLADDPMLTDRTGLVRRRPLLRIVLDSRLRIPLDAKMLHPVEDDLWIFCAHGAPVEAQLQLEALGARITRMESAGTLDLDAVLAHLHQAKVLSVLLEAGSQLNGAFLRGDLVDRVVLYYAETELGRDSIPFAAAGPSPFALEQALLGVEKSAIGPDIRVSGLLHDPWVATPEAPLR